MLKRPNQAPVSVEEMDIAEGRRPNQSIADTNVLVRFKMIRSSLLR